MKPLACVALAACWLVSPAVILAQVRPGMPVRPGAPPPQAVPPGATSAPAVPPPPAAPAATRPAPTQGPSDSTANRPRDQAQRPGQEDRGKQSAPGNRSLDDMVDALLKQLDNDHDGRLSAKEARGMFLELFDWIDLNQDGYLDRDELRKALERYPGLRGPNSGVAALDRPAAQQNTRELTTGQSSQTDGTPVGGNQNGGGSRTGRTSATGGK